MHQRWQYQIEQRIFGAKYDEDEYSWLQRLGSHGWQLAGVVEELRGMGRTYYFKRPLYV